MFPEGQLKVFNWGALVHPQATCPLSAQLPPLLSPASLIHATGPSSRRVKVHQSFDSMSPSQPSLSRPDLKDQGPPRWPHTCGFHFSLVVFLPPKAPACEPPCVPSPRPRFQHLQDKQAGPGFGWQVGCDVNIQVKPK